MSEELKSKFEEIIKQHLPNEDSAVPTIRLMQAAYDMAKAENNILLEDVKELAQSYISKQNYNERGLPHVFKLRQYSGSDIREMAYDFLNTATPPNQ